MATPHSVTREKLYEEVWKTPILQLSKCYGISDVALAKVCRKMDVPRPYRGYWSRLQAGQTPKKTPLPMAKAATVISHEFTRRDSVVTLSRSQPIKLERAELRSPIIVPPSITKPHPLIKASRAELKRQSSFRYGDPIYFSRRHVSVIVHRKAQRRAFRIMDAFLKAIEARGHSVAIATCYYGGGCAVILALLRLSQAKGNSS